jgi:endonuclease/exonuclease/phosphatase (EEP) superfamily protein YafD
MKPVPGIPIDHVLVTPDLVPLRVERGPDVGSDHFPLFVELALP